MVNYELNPFYISQLLSTPGISAIDRLVFRELLDLCWMTEDRDRISFETSELATKIGLHSGDIDKSIEKLSSPDYDLIKFYIDLDSDIPESIVRVPYLSRYLESKRKEEVEKDTESFSESAELNNTVSIIDRIKKRDSDFEPSILFLDRSEKALASSFSGWIPTKGFDQKGEAYNIRDHIYQSLKKSFGIDPDPIFKDMFAWLMSNPKKRPSQKNINDFIFRWFSNIDEKKKKQVTVSSCAKDQTALDMLSDISDN